MHGSAAARRYARALFSLAGEADAVAEVGRELDVLGELLDSSPMLRRTLLTPLHPARERKRVLVALAEELTLGDTLRQFCTFLIDRRRLVDFPAIRDEYARLAEEASGRIRAEVVTAGPLDPERERRLREALSRRTGREVQLQVRIDPELIAGAVAVVGDLVFDGSLRNQLIQLRASLSKD